MKYFVGVTDHSRFEFLARRQPIEVNFWRPSPVAFRAIEPGAPFLFKLSAPESAIAGGGFFVRYARFPLSIVWNAFKENNGVADRAALRDAVYEYRRGEHEPDPQIGCIILTSPFFFARDEWIPEPPDWRSNLVQGKSYDTAEPVGGALWAEVEARVRAQGARGGRPRQPALNPWGVARERYDEAYLTRSWLGPGAFRLLVTEAYGRRCAISGDGTLPTLHATHLRPIDAGGTHVVANGILLRADLHILFDLGYLSLTDEPRVMVSPRIAREYGENHPYRAYDDQPLAVLPETPRDRPDPAFLAWHRTHRYVD